jgi:hypothetical protein
VVKIGSEAETTILCVNPCFFHKAIFLILLKRNYMEAQLTLHLNEHTLYAAEQLAQRQGMTLDKLTETLLEKAAASQYKSLDDLPIADWVQALGEGEPEYHPLTRQQLKDEYFQSKR